jgi:integrase
MMLQIRAELRAGTFDIGRHFPDSPRAKKLAADTLTFGKAADEWLQTQAGALAPATEAQYRNALEFWKRKLGADKAMAEVTHKMLAGVIGKHKWPGARLHNNYLIPLRGVFGMEYRGADALRNPMGGIENRAVVRKLPDPLTIDDRDQILADMRQHYDLRVWAYFQWAFFTGMRPEEIIALQWGDIDWKRRVARVQRVRTFQGGEREGSKTHSVRDVDLVPEAFEALTAMKPRTMLKRDEAGREADIFENPVTARPWHDERSQRDHYWHPALLRLGIRRRRPYATRHTYCTVALMAGVKPAYIAAQAGHSVKMLLDSYARWIPENDGGSERERMAAAMAGRSGDTERAAS